MSCFWRSERLLKAFTTPLASLALPWFCVPLACWPIASARSEDAPVVQEEEALPEPPERRGAELASARPALRHAVGKVRPHVVQRRDPSRDSRSGSAAPRRTRCRSCSVGVWQSAQPVLAKSCLPLLIDVEPPGVSVDGVGGARKRWKSANSDDVRERRRSASWRPRVGRSRSAPRPPGTRPSRCAPWGRARWRCPSPRCRPRPRISSATCSAPSSRSA